MLKNRHTKRLTADISTQKGKHKIKNEVSCSAVIEIHKY